MIYKIEWSEWQDDFKTMSEGDDATVMVTHTGGMAMQTPLGMLPIPMSNIQFVSDTINLYLMQTNFDITNTIARTVSMVRGVVSVEPITRYMLRVGIPSSQLFDDNDVQDEIEKALLYFFDSRHREILSEFRDDIKAKVMEFRNHLNKRQEYWAMLVLPNGSIEVASTNILNDAYKQKCSKIHAMHKQIGGKILTSHDSEAFHA